MMLSARHFDAFRCRAAMLSMLSTLLRFIDIITPLLTFLSRRDAITFAISMLRLLLRCFR